MIGDQIMIPQIKPRYFHFTLADDENEIFSRKAISYHMKKTAYLKELIFEGNIKWRNNFNDEQMNQLRTEFNRIGVNICQITRRANESRNTFAESFDEKEQEIEFVIDFFVSLMRKDY